MFFGRGISAFFNQFFKWLFWNKTGQKLLFSVLIVFIFFCFIKLGEVSAVEEVSDINYEVKSYYDGIVNDAIMRLYRYFETNGKNNNIYTLITNQNYTFYFYYGNQDGSSYANAKPLGSQYLNIAYRSRFISPGGSITNNDYMGVTSYPLYTYSAFYGMTFNQQNLTNFSNISVQYPIFYATYTNYNWTVFVQSLINNDNETIIQLLEDIQEDTSNISEALTNTDPTSETDSFVEVDSSAIDDLSSSSVDNVFSTMTTGFANKFTNYDLSTVNSFVWNFKGTTITFYSDTIYKMIRGTFFETLLSMLWYYIFGHYAFVWLSSIIHKIKDGSILDGLQVNEVITKEML